MFKNAQDWQKRAYKPDEKSIVLKDWLGFIKYNIKDYEQGKLIERIFHPWDNQDKTLKIYWSLVKRKFKDIKFIPWKNIH
jgi:xanthine dehydrogenase iron-sulfur cluster and FAD-binding subunit A